VLLPTRVGRSRTLEIVIGADDFDGNAAAQYGCISSCSALDRLSLHRANSPTLTLNLKGINRAIPDDQFEYFIDKFARRVASWDHFGIATAKQLINKNSGFPTVAAWEETWDAFQECIKQPLAQARIQALIKAGLQANVTFEKNMGEELLRFVGSGPFDV